MHVIHPALYRGGSQKCRNSVSINSVSKMYCKLMNGIYFERHVSVLSIRLGLRSCFSTTCSLKTQKHRSNMLLNWLSNCPLISLSFALMMCLSPKSKMSSAKLYRMRMLFSHRNWLLF